MSSYGISRILMSTWSGEIRSTRRTIEVSAPAEVNKRACPGGHRTEIDSRYIRTVANFCAGRMSPRMAIICPQAPSRDSRSAKILHGDTNTRGEDATPPGSGDDPKNLGPSGRPLVGLAEAARLWLAPPAAFRYRAATRVDTLGGNAAEGRRACMIPKSRFWTRSCTAVTAFDVCGKHIAGRERSRTTRKEMP